MSHLTGEEVDIAISEILHLFIAKNENEKQLDLSSVLKGKRQLAHKWCCEELYIFGRLLSAL